MKRRTFIAGLGCAVSWPMVARAQSALPVIGFLHSASSDPHSSYASATVAFRRGLADAGFLEGRDVMIAFQWANDQFELLPLLASDLVRQKVSLIFAGGGEVAALAAKKATTTIPIVFAIGADPVKQGIVSSLSRPEANVTGATFLSVEIRPKILEVIRELVPNATTVAVLGNPNRPNFKSLLKEVLDPARMLGLQVRVLEADGRSEIDTAFRTFSRTRDDALLVLSDPVYLNQRDEIARLALQYKIPAVYSSREHVAVGGLASYGASLQDAYYQAGQYCGRILKGERPSDLPVLQPTKFELVLNLKTAKALGLTVPPTLLARAHEVIE